MKQRCIILVDGSNFYFKLKDLKLENLLSFSSDTDLLPAVKKAEEKGKKVEYIGFSHQPSVTMVANCSSSRLLTKEDLLAFIPTKKREK